MSKVSHNASIKIYQSALLDSLLAEMTQTVTVIYEVAEAVSPELEAALHQLSTLTPHLVWRTQPIADFYDRVVISAEGQAELVFLGAPMGTELAALVSAIVISGRGDSRLPEVVKLGLRELPPDPLQLEVFTTPT